MLGAVFLCRKGPCCVADLDALDSGMLGSAAFQGGFETEASMVFYGVHRLAEGFARTLRMYDSRPRVRRA